MNHLAELTRYVERWGMQDWLLVFIAVVVVGLLSLRGFGSRSQY